MDQLEHETKPDAFCVFCGGRYPDQRIAAHVKFCAFRKAMSHAAGANVERVPEAFILMARVDEIPDLWLCLEAHCGSLFSDLDLFFRYGWFPQVETPGMFFHSTTKLPRGADIPQVPHLEVPLEDRLKVKDRFYYFIETGDLGLIINLNVVDRQRSAFVDRPVDALAFPMAKRSSEKKGRDTFGLPEDWDKAGGQRG